MDWQWKGGARLLSKKNKPCDQVPIDFFPNLEIQLSGNEKFKKIES